MGITDLIPWKRDKAKIDIHRQWEEAQLDAWDEMDRMLQDISRTLFVDAPLGSWLAESRGFVPRVDVHETDEAVKVSAELPGMSDQDISVSVGRGSLTIKGDKRQEREERRGRYYHLERSYGGFQRRISIPEGIDDSDAEAVFESGVLRIVLPKIQDKAKARRIKVRKGQSSTGN
jgi:HSP20 family protein